MPFQKGWKGGPGRPRGERNPTILYDIKQAARAYCPEAIELIAKHMRSDDERVSLMASIAMIERGYGKPEQRTDSAVTHKFAVVPQVMEEELWLARKGQPLPALPPPPDDDPERELN